MRSSKLLFVILSVGWWVGGCSDYQPAPSRAQPGAPPAQGSGVAASDGAKPAPATGSAPAPAAQALAPLAAQAPAGVEVRLSAGVALPQTLPEGSVMTFSVDYEFLPGHAPMSSNRYFLVIRPPQGTPARIAVQLNPKDTLRTISNWPPSDGPFWAHLEDASGRRLSEPVQLR